MRIIDGNAIAAEVRTVVANDVARIKMAGVCPTLAVILVGSNEASKVYVTRKIAACNQVGIRSLEHRLGPEVGQPELLALIDVLNDDPNVHGILVQQAKVSSPRLTSIATCALNSALSRFLVVFLPVHSSRRDELNILSSFPAPPQDVSRTNGMRRPEDGKCLSAT